MNHIEPIRADDPEAGRKIFALLEAAAPDSETVTFPFSVNGYSFNVTMPTASEVVIQRLADFYRDQVLGEYARRNELIDHYAEHPRADGRFEG